ncbi:dodecin [Sungkyunkwania multivorans]|uniref:Dodecin n=1 Tax=Sungkyunkwania multivorans TaxID=1173618 RepID=A0ABW3CWX9_9FLAO
MSDHVYKSIEITGTSQESFGHAVENAVARASKTIDNLRWFQVIDTRGSIEDGKINRWQVTAKLGFTMKE